MYRVFFILAVIFIVGCSPDNQAPEINYARVDVIHNPIDYLSSELAQLGYNYNTDFDRSISLFFYTNVTDPEGADDIESVWVEFPGSTYDGTTRVLMKNENVANEYRSYWTKFNPNGTWAETTGYTLYVQDKAGNTVSTPVNMRMPNNEALGVNDNYVFGEAYANEKGTNGFNALSLPTIRDVSISDNTSGSFVISNDESRSDRYAVYLNYNKGTSIDPEYVYLCKYESAEGDDVILATETVINFTTSDTDRVTCKDAYHTGSAQLADVEFAQIRNYDDRSDVIESNGHFHYFSLSTMEPVTVP